MGCPVCEGRLDGGRKASRDYSEIEKNLKFTIEQNIVEINRLKALVDEANNKQKKYQTEIDSKQIKIDELELRLGLSEISLTDEEKLNKISSLEKRIKTFVVENIQLKKKNEQIKTAMLKQREILIDFKDKNTKLRSKNDELTRDNQVLSKHYTEKKAFIEEIQAKEASVKEANKRESKKCLEIALEAKKLKDWLKTERLYRKASKLDFDINLAQLLTELEDAKNAEEEELKAKLKAEEDRKRAEAITKAKQMQDEEMKRRQDRKDHGEAGDEIDRILNIVKNYDSVKQDRTLAFLVMKLDRSLDAESAKTELKKNFVKLSRLLHPDKCPLGNAKAAFQAIEASNRKLKEHFDDPAKSPFKEPPQRNCNYKPRNYESYKQNGGGPGAYSGVWTPPKTFNTSPSTGWRYKQKMRQQATEDWANKSFNNQNNHQQNKQQQQKEYYRSFNPPNPPGTTWTTGSPKFASTTNTGPSTPNGFHQPKPQNSTDNWFRDRFDNFD